ncbi:endonuclease [soil metagenome]
MKKTIKYGGRIIIALVAIALLYVGGMIIYGTVTDYQPEETIQLSTWGTSDETIATNNFTFVIWNIGYAGLGDKEDFFYDGGKGVRPEKEQQEIYMHGIENTIGEMAGTDFIMIQEIDTNSKRSYYGNQLHRIGANLPGYAYSYATNYQVDFVPMPLTGSPTSAYGKVQAGLGTFSKYAPASATRYQYPGKFGWPKSVFMLDRCMLVMRYPLASGKELLVINTHNSAYDTDGTIKGAEMQYIKDFITKEYNNGNYVVIGGDWNQNPPNFTSNPFNAGKETYGQGIIEKDFMPEGWIFAYDATVPTNRNLSAAYKAGETTVDVIDYFLISPNIELLDLKTMDMQFAYSDHQPVKIEVRLK